MLSQKKHQNLRFIIFLILFGSCASQKSTPKFIFPTFKQWKSLNEFEMNIVNDYTYKNNFIDQKFKHLKKIKFNKRGRKILEEIRLKDSIIK